MRLIRSDKRVYSAENRPNLPIKKEIKNQDFFGSNSRYSELKKKNENLESLKNFNYKLEREILLRQSYEKVGIEKDGKLKEIDIIMWNEKLSNAIIKLMPKLKFMPLSWRVFFLFIKMKFTFGVYVLLFLMNKLRGEV